MSKREACAWCGATDQLMVRLNQGTPVNACVDWYACGDREQAKNAADPGYTFGRKTPLTQAKAGADALRRSSRDEEEQVPVQREAASQRVTSPALPNFSQLQQAPSLKECRAQRT
jgi:hypothetical protein